MPEHEPVPRRSPRTLRSARLGREFRALRESKGWTMEHAAATLDKSQSWVSRVEAGLIKVGAGDAALLLMTYGVPLDSERGKATIATAKALKEDGWWQRMETLSLKYMQYIAFEAEATQIRSYDPTLVHGLLQTAEYAEAIARVGHETAPQAVEQSVDAKLKRQAVREREPVPPLIHVIVSEAALLCEVGGPAVLAAQLRHIVELATGQPHVIVQVLRFAAGAHLADRGMFTILGFEGDDPDLGYIDTTGGGALFLESSDDVSRLSTIFDDLKTRSMSPAESLRYIDAKARQWTKN